MFTQKFGLSSPALLQREPLADSSSAGQAAIDMDEKRRILDTLLPKAVLTAMTPEARAALPATLQAIGMISILSFPFRVGRESRVMIINNTVHRVERPTVSGSVPNNEIYLMDNGQLLQISREHFQIEKTAAGYKLTDRGSKCGLSINDRRLGMEAGMMSMSLHDGDVIAIGTGITPYRYTFVAGFENVPR